MYQALYRKWRPRTFDDVVGQEHITETLKRQVESGRLSHAYLFTGTRGTGKTTCAKLLARAVNCEHPENGSPCNHCPACQGIENGSILDVLELDAASNNRVDDIRAILDEASYTPASVKKRVYIVDEVHMLSAQAFNALLQILEEPPEHLMFILATTEIHKVPATIKSRCQQFSFKRIQADSIAARLRYVAEQEGLKLTAEGAALLARLADGGMRDALSLLDQCVGSDAEIGEEEILTTLGLAGNVDTANLMSAVAAGETESVLTQLNRLYAGGKELSALLGELATLTRDLLIRKTAPGTGASLMTGGFDSGVLKELAAVLPVPRLIQMLSVLQRVSADLPRSANRRVDVELCLLALCDPSLDGSVAGLTARVDALERRLNEGDVPAAAVRIPGAGEGKRGSDRIDSSVGPQRQGTNGLPECGEDLPPWELEPQPPVVVEKPASHQEAVPERVGQTVQKPQRETGTANGGDWANLRSRLEKTLNVADFCFIGNPTMVTGSIQGDTVTLWADTEMVRGLIDKPDITAAVSETAQNMLGRAMHTVVKVGKAPEQPAPSLECNQEYDALEEFLAASQGLGNITVTD